MKKDSIRIKAELKKEIEKDMKVTSFKLLETQGLDHYSFLLNKDKLVKYPRNKEHSFQVIRERKYSDYIFNNLKWPKTHKVLFYSSSPLDSYEWNVYLFIPGTSASYKNISEEDLAEGIAKILKNLQSISIKGYEYIKPSRSNCYRGANIVKTYGHEVHEAINNMIGKEKNQYITLLKDFWDVVEESKISDKKVWVHGDIALDNILVENRKVSGIIDMGQLSVGDPSTDYAIAFSWSEDVRDKFFKYLSLDITDQLLAAGWAFWKAINDYEETKNREIISKILTWARDENII